MPTRTLLAILAALPAFAAGPMPAAQQNVLTQKYCAVCHTDAAPLGGLSLQHFDAALAAPSLSAMMVSKLTSGVPLATVQAAPANAEAAALVARKMKTGAMGASGIPRPDPPTTEAFIHALAAHSARATEWHFNQSASILRELPNAEENRSYRLTLTCHPTGKGELQIAWSPAPKLGPISISIDRNPPRQFTTGFDGAAVRLPISLPTTSLQIINLFPNETVDFPFHTLPAAARHSLAPCFK